MFICGENKLSGARVFGEPYVILVANFNIVTQAAKISSGRRVFRREMRKTGVARRKI
jgi:hypothetical protein